MVAILAYRSWRDLRSAAHAHGLPFYTRHAKAQAYARLYGQLIDAATLKQRLKHLSAEERDALTVLQAAGGSIPYHAFTAAYGAIRIWRPWRKHIPYQPWKRPLSVAEALWHLGFIEIVPGNPEQVVLPEEVAVLLPALPRPQPLPYAAPEMPINPRDALCVDLAWLLGFLLRHPFRPRQGRWLPVRALRAMNSVMQVPDSLAGVRSELQTSRLRFLHFLAEAAGLVAVQGGYLKPTAAAWQWLAQPPEARWRCLWSVMDKEVNTPHHPLWERYRLPPVERKAWQTVTTLLQTLTPTCAYSFALLGQIVKLRLPGSDGVSALWDLLSGPLALIGMATLDDEAVVILPTTSSEPQPAAIAVDAEAITLSLPPNLPLHPLVACLAWADSERGLLRVDAAGVSRAMGQGYDAPGVIQMLAALAGRALPRMALENIERWMHEAAALKVEMMALLTVRDDSVLGELRADWRLRPLMGTPLSPHHVALPVDHARALLPKLARRGHAVTSSLPPPVPDDAPFSREMAAYCWLAGRVYQQIGALVEPTVRIPGAVLDWLAAQLGAGQRETLEAEAKALVTRVAQHREGTFAAFGGVEQDAPDAIRAAVQAAYEAREAVTLEYLSPARGERTVRTIEPIMLYQRAGVDYVEAWCRLDEATRTFRMDRVLRIVEAQNDS